MRILLVEDDELNQKYFMRSLKKKNLLCDLATNGKEAVAAFSEKKYDLIFMDCQMPVMDGYEATKCIRKIEGNEQKTIIIALTAHALVGDDQKCFDAGMNDYIAKPVSLETLFEVIDKYSEKK